MFRRFTLSNLWHRLTFAPSERSQTRILPDPLRPPFLNMAECVFESTSPQDPNPPLLFPRTLSNIAQEAYSERTPFNLSQNRALQTLSVRHSCSWQDTFFDPRHLRTLTLSAHIFVARSLLGALSPSRPFLLAIPLGARHRGADNKVSYGF